MSSVCVFVCVCTWRVLVHGCARVCACMCAHTCLCVYVCTSVHACVLCMCVRACGCVHVCALLSLCVHVCTRMCCVCTCTRVCAHSPMFRWAFARIYVEAIGQLQALLGSSGCCPSCFWRQNLLHDLVLASLVRRAGWWALELSVSAPSPSGLQTSALLHRLWGLNLGPHALTG